ncbi:hypothetical protein Ddye_020977 [Dipteronia dyeriana]|uniref:Uncharacterized protein n=1 Tax=Dipteronia dyeriana TaxID=168575 RepID=A0AAD9WXA0_9ROSI|nr:hypothetical protein Ddye_020977 [Dipteronia dyeriana]
MVDRIHNLTRILKVWNKEKFGNIFYNKRRLLARIQGIQHHLSDKPSVFLSSLEESLLKDYRDIFEREEIFWQQKSRNCWLKEDDRNTKIFHFSMVIRKRRNKTEGLTKKDGSWTGDIRKMKTEAVQYFQDLFFSWKGIVLVSILKFYCFSLRISEAELTGLFQTVDEFEVKNSLFSISELKALGPDRSPTILFQIFWIVCKGDLMDLVLDCFTKGCMPSLLNSTLISLIPKIPNPTNLSHFRIISLCNTS